MPSNERNLIDHLTQEAQASRAVPYPDDIAFELFAAETMLRDRNLSEEEIESGRIGGGKDGGIDAVYTFVDDALLDEDWTMFDQDAPASKIRKGVELECVFIQAKREESFTETAFDKAESSLRRLLSLESTDAELLVLYSAELIGRVRLFTEAWKKLLTRSPKISLQFAYVTRGETETAGPPVVMKANDLRKLLEECVPNASARVDLVGASQLWERASTTPEYDLQIQFDDYVTRGQSYAGLVTLNNYHKFLSDEAGNLRPHIFDWNVRDFQGDVTVNREIQRSLETVNGDDFWWLNNGVTILCSKAVIGGGKTFTLEGVQIVNGMQTSHRIHTAVSSSVEGDGFEGDRAVQVRVIETQDEAARDRIIRATNSQTKVPDASLHATEEIHRQIEAHFLANGWFYDRRKNFYKNHGKPSDKIIGIPALGQSIMAIGLSRPNDARARPTTILNAENDYNSIFDSSLPLSVYLWVARVQKMVDQLLLSEPDAALRANFRYYVSLYWATARFGARIYSPKQLVELSRAGEVPSLLEVMNVLSEIESLASTLAVQQDWTLDRVAKNRLLTELVIDEALAGAPEPAE
ncbi:AIPR family protein [Curtobacterium sp. MCBA15_009]|uniref:AIPR family protein n=1 Tax=Curtobacterium sp. MCBA15_009 TaxID=1898737 RepID=UPI000B1F62F6|nr:AIPR family protein [Curtobacterium sp. MCBA15_009]